MTTKLRIVIAQLNLLVGDIEGNLQKHIDAATTARDTLKADVIVFPELSLTGYPPEDLLLRKAFLDASNDALTKFKNTVKNIHCVIGHPHITTHGLENAASIIRDGVILGRYAKQKLPNYGVFDERRYFVPGNTPLVIPIKGIPVGIVICEDLWVEGPAKDAANHGARILLSPNASPFEINKQQRREDILTKRAKADNIPIFYINCIGGYDDLIFDGGSMVINAEGVICQHAGMFIENLLPVEVDVSNMETKIAATSFTLPTEEEKIYSALVLAVRDYVQKNNFPGALIGLSGGIDSALTLAIAVDALGKDKVTAVTMPSRYTQDISVEDSIAMAALLDVKLENISIEPSFKSFLTTLAPIFGDKKPDITEENIQARCRAVILMALSNNSGRIVLTTSNRSEMAVGYSTLYGDMAGGFAVLKDVPKMLVYQLSRYRNSISAVIPERIIERAPTAELSLNQKDEDSLPPYPILDKILELYLNKGLSLDEIVAEGFDVVIVSKIANMVNRNEYKRKQSAIGPRIENTAFGRDRRYPNTYQFRENIKAK